jgi:phosphatidylinositol alpha-mannosyltransferase
VLRDDGLRDKARAHAADVVERYDWSHVTHEVLTVYEMVAAGSGRHVGEDPSSRRAAFGRLVRSDRWER